MTDFAIMLQHAFVLARSGWTNVLGVSWFIWSLRMRGYLCGALIAASVEYGLPPQSHVS